MPLNNVNLGSFISPNNSRNAFFSAAVPPASPLNPISKLFNFPVSADFCVYLKSGNGFGFFIFCA